MIKHYEDQNASGYEVEDKEEDKLENQGDQAEGENA
jgi:hypothetical protein